MSKPHSLACTDTRRAEISKLGGETAGLYIRVKAAKNKTVFLPCEVEPDTTHGEGTLCEGESSDSVAKVEAA